ncbi:DUF2637 domain-containing protein [Streptomyces sp. NPDC000888]
MRKPSAVQALALGAAVVTVALTGAAFWLSYEHLHDVAEGNGLDGIRAWAWPGTVDLFIVAGELLILRAALRDRFDWFAYLLAGVGSLGSIALNVAGVGAGAAAMEYVVAAVPPVAALLAFAAIMRQVHERLVPDAEPIKLDVIQLEDSTTVEPPTVTLERDTQQDADGTPELPPGTDQDAEGGLPPEPPLMTSSQVAERYGIAMSTVRSWVDTGRLTVHSKDARNRNLFHPDALPELEAVRS